MQFAPLTGRAASAATGAVTVSDLLKARVDQKVFDSYFRSGPEIGAFDAIGELSADEGYFVFDGTICYGRRYGGPPAAHVTDALPDVSGLAESARHTVRLPFDLTEVVTNLQQER